MILNIDGYRVGAVTKLLQCCDFQVAATRFMRLIAVILLTQNPSHVVVPIFFSIIPELPQYTPQVGMLASRQLSTFLVCLAHQF